jgi:PAS domain S-box-containing protein
MSFNYLVFPSAGSLSVAVVAAFIFILQIRFATKRSEFRWFVWSAAISFSTILYAVGILLEYNAPEGQVNRFGGLLEWTAVIFLVHALYGLVFSRLNIPSRRYHLAAGSFHVLILILLWSTNILVSDHFVHRPFPTLAKPFVEAELGPLGPVFILYALGASINAIRLWIVKEKDRGTPSRAIVWGASFWVLLGAHDAAAAMGLPTFQYVMEYGFLGFSAALFYTMFSDYVRTSDALAQSNIILRKEMETRKRVEQERSESEERYRTLFELESDAILLIDDETQRIVEANEAALRLYGYSREELLSSKILDLSAEPEKTLKGIRQRETHTPMRWHLKKDGSRFPVEITRNLFELQGREAHISAVRDISSRLEAERELHETQAYLMSILDNAPALIYVNTPDNRYRLVNKAWERFTGKTNEEMQGRCIEEIFSANTARGFMAAHQKVVETGLPVVSEETVVGPEGKVLFHTVKFPIWDSAGRIDAVCGISFDITERRKAEEALRESEERFRTIINNSKEGIVLQEISGRILSWNPTAERVFGISEEEAAKHTYTTRDWNTIREDGSLFPGSDHPSIYTLSTGMSCENVVMGVKSALGGVTWININTNPLFRGKDSHPYAVVITFSDITERKRAEEALKKSEGLHKEAQRVAHIGHWELDPDIGTPLWSDEIFRIFGLEADEGEPSFNEHDTYVHPEDWPLLNKAVRRAGTDGTPFDLVFRIVKPGGKMGWMHAIGTTSMDDEGNVTKLFGTAQDITVLRKAEEDLRESEEKYRSLVESTEDSIYLVDRECKYLYMNRMHLSRFGVKASQVIGKRYDDFHSKKETEGFKLMVNEVIKKSKSYRHVYESRRGGGHYLRTLSPVKDPERKTKSVTVVSKNITELIQVEEALRQKNEALSRVHKQRKILSKRLIDLLENDRRQIAMELHDNIGQTLTSLKMDIEMIHGKLKPEQRALRARITEVQEKAIQAIKDVKNISRGLRPGILDALGLVPCLRELFSEIQRQMDIEIKFFSRDIPKRFAPEKEVAIYRIVQEALTNIIRNANAKNVFVNLVRKDENLSLSVEDDGVGFDLDKVMTFSKNGGPLGILIMQERAEQLGGEFTLESQPGKGTHVLVEIPL